MITFYIDLREALSVSTILSKPINMSPVIPEMKIESYDHGKFINIDSQKELLIERCNT